MLLCWRRSYSMQLSPELDLSWAKAAMCPPTPFQMTYSRHVMSSAVFPPNLIFAISPAAFSTWPLPATLLLLTFRMPTKATLIKNLHHVLWRDKINWWYTLKKLFIGATDTAYDITAICSSGTLVFALFYLQTLFEGTFTLMMGMQRRQSVHQLDLTNEPRILFNFLIVPFNAVRCQIFCRLKVKSETVSAKVVMSKDASFFTHYYSHNVYSVKTKLNLEAKNALEK
jgi:hypothetical protein